MYQEDMSSDYSAFVVLDVTQAPYKIVAKYRDNDIKPLVFPSIIEKVAKTYNNSFVLDRDKRLRTTSGGQFTIRVRI